MVLREQIKRLSLMTFKLGLHAVQAFFTVIAWILTIAVIAKPGGNSSASYWYFFLTWITFAALAHQALLPLWQRTRRFKNIYASFAIDVLFTIFWISAFASVQVWTASGVPSSSTGYCKDFQYGDDDRCTISFGTVVIGVLMFITFLIAAGVSGYKVWYFRKNGYCISQRPSISKPIEAKLVYSENSSRQGSQGSRDHHDLEKGAFPRQAPEGLLHLPRKLSWDAAPLSAPACAPEFPEAKPTFRMVDYERPTETSHLSQYAPMSRRPVTQNRSISPPKLQLYGPGDRTPALVMDYGATTPYAAPDPYAPSLRYSHNAYPVSPVNRNYRGSMTPAPFATNYDQQHNMYQGGYQGAYQAGQGTFAGGYRSNYASCVPAGQGTFTGGYRSNYASGVPAASGGYETHNRRGSGMRMALPGAATHTGGYHSAYHTPLPSAMMSPSRGGATYGGFKRESTVQFYSQQQAFADRNYHAR